MSSQPGRFKPFETQGKADSAAPAQAEVARKWVRFEVVAEAGSKVYVAGTFNDWDPEKDEMTEEKGVFGVSVLVPVGRHEYKLVINGLWTADPRCPEWVPNGLGSLNSVLVVS